MCLRKNEILSYCVEVYTLIKNSIKDFPKNYSEEMTREFKPLENRIMEGFNMVPEVTTNTLLHLIEGIALYVNATNDTGAKRKVIELFKILFKYGYDEENKNLYQFLNYNLESVIDVFSYGHNLEVSWLFMEAMKQCNIENEEYKKICIDLFDKSFGLSYYNGYIINETVNGKTDRSAIWWVQAESLAALTNMYNIDPKEEYLDAIKSITDFIINKFSQKGLDWHW